MRLRGDNNEEEAAREQVSQTEARDIHREEEKEEKETNDKARTAIERTTRRQNPAIGRRWYSS